jgi:hypothetical protein
VGCGGKGLKIIEEISAVVAASLCTICSLSLPSYSRPSLPKESFDGFVRSARVLENHSCVFCSHGDCVCFVGSVLLTRIRRQQTITVQFHSWLDLRGRAGRPLGPLKYCGPLNIYLSIIFSYLENSNHKPRSWALLFNLATCSICLGPKYNCLFQP